MRTDSDGRPDPLDVFRLCYVEGDWAWFTTRPVTEQWGDDWDDVPYEHNAGDPYEWVASDAERGVPYYALLKVAFETYLETPDMGYFNSPYSVRDINAGAIAWLRSPSWEQREGRCIEIAAGASVSAFLCGIYDAGGMIWLPPDCLFTARELASKSASR